MAAVAPLSPASSYDSLAAALAEERAQLLAHPLYTCVHTLPALRTFMEAHVFAVWDFMSLLKSLQRRLTCVDVPWTPPRSRLAARLVNTLVLAEESDEIAGASGSAQPISHFELYLEAMREVGADTRPIERHLHALARGATVSAALEVAKAPAHARRFVLGTFSVLASPHDEAVAAAFLVGREDLVPEMFRRLLPEVARARPAARDGWLALYLARHIDVDEGDHGPKARALVTELCARTGSRDAWQRATSAGHEALAARRALWDGVVASLDGTG